MELIEGSAGRPPEPDWQEIFPGSDAAADRANASRYWNSAADELQRDEKLSIVNAHALQRLVIAYVTYDRAAAKVASEGAIVPAPKTKTPMHSPWWTAMQAASRMATAIEGELTISPRRRASGGKVAKPKRKPGAADQYLKSVPTKEKNDD
ncbi:P27 family phage terminase small subunit [Altericroceibacterium xinjiangense]|uniref:P27 family phage terminase small subunit n=1 Tax=Altericroceibacterium xinjiangense TaxID=762261 RepID=UPI000F7F2BC6|nr:P27 family phage terminase small subunit [Altericroceibacterium xinjiangense]